MITSLATLLLLFPAPPQGVPVENPLSDTSPEVLQAKGWDLVDGVMSQAGDAPITWGDLEAYRSGSAEPPSAPEALKWVRLALLEQQAGEDMGVDPADVEMIVRSDLENKRMEQGAGAYRDILAERGLDPQSALESESKELSRVLWRRSRIGMPGPRGQRPFRDPYVRPGTLRSLYRLQGADLKRTLGDPDEVRFQVLAISSAALGGLENAEEFAGTLRERAVAGEDYGDLVLEYSAMGRDTAGLTSWYEADRLTEDAEREFAQTAAIGTISVPFPLRQQDGTVSGYRLLRLHDRREGRPAPPFSHREVQTWLRNSYERSWRMALLERDWRILDTQSFSWLHPALERAAEAAGMGPGPNGSPPGR